jgi:hypothetical protein
MKILVISRSFFPINSPRSFRTTQLVKEFSKQGHDVTLYTLKDDLTHEPFEEEFGVTIKNLGPLKLPAIDTSSGRRVTRLLKRIVKRGLHLLVEYPDIELMWRGKQVLKKENGYDLMISIAVPHPTHWGVAWARNKKHSIATTWAADCGDPYMGAKLDSFNKLFYFSFFEKWFCKKSDVITVPIEDAKEGYYPEFRNKIEVIPQGFNFDEVSIHKDEVNRNDIPIFGYAGSLIPDSRDPRALLDYLCTLDRDFRFIFYTRTTSLVEPYVKKSSGKIEIRDYIPREELLKEMASMDFLVNFENSSSMMMPSKLIDYHLTGRPVLSVGSDKLDKKSVDRFLDGDYSGKLDMENMDRYRIDRVSKQFLSLCETPG